MNEIMNINGIECFERNGTAYLKLETVARGLGFIRIADSGNEVVRWERVRKYLSEIGAVPTSGHDIPTSGDREKLPDFIPENIFYRLAMKAKNETAEKFQALVADEIIPSIRKTGGYIAGQEQLTDAELMARALMVAQKTIESRTEEVKSLKLENAVQQQQIAELNPKATYYDLVLQCPDLVSVTEIAKDYGKSAKWLNKVLAENNVQYNARGIWILYQKYAEKGYTYTKKNPVAGKDGIQHTKPHTYWTQKGRLFLYEFLKGLGYLPIVEQQIEDKNASQLKRYENDMKSFGTFGILNAESTGGRPETYYQMNEEQAAFLMTLLRNSPQVVAFKKELVRQFYAMRRLIMERQTGEWQETRRLGKLSRKAETDTLKQLVEYAAQQGSEHPDKLYLVYSKLANKMIGISKRDTATVSQLNNLSLAENIILHCVEAGMAAGKHYKEIYQDSKARLNMFKDIAFLEG